MEGESSYLSSMEHFTTSRLTAERLDQGHLADLVALHLDPDVSRYLGGVRSPEATATYLTVNIAHWERHGFGLWVLRTHTGEFAGRAGIRHLVLDGVDEVEIAYTFKRVLWGQGLATEITKALMNLGLVQLEFPSLVGVVAVENAASRHVLEKSEFTLERSGIFHGDEVVIYRSSIGVHAPGRRPTRKQPRLQASRRKRIQAGFPQSSLSQAQFDRHIIESPGSETAVEMPQSRNDHAGNRYPDVRPGLVENEKIQAETFGKLDASQNLIAPIHLYKFTGSRAPGD